MRKFTGIVVLLLALVAQGFSQATFIAVNNGSWNASNVWSLDGATPITCAPCVAGVDYPGALDDAFTNGRTLTITTGATVKNLAVSYDVAGALLGSAQITITGTLAGWDDLQSIPAVPVVNVFGSTTPIFRFTASNLDGVNPFYVLVSNEVLGFWNSTSPFNTVLFQLTKDAVLDGGDPFGGVASGELRFGSLTVSGGTTSAPLQLTTGFYITAIRPTSLTISQNTSLISDVPISNATGTITTSRMTVASIQGRLWAGSYLNAVTVSVGATGRLESSFNGADQTQGWWYGSTSPGTVTLTAGSTVAFDYEGDQYVPTRVYSNLILDGSGTKRLNGVTAFTVTNLSVLTDVTLTSLPATARNISGNLIVDGTWQPSLTVFFNGSSGTQTVSGSGLLNFNGSINKTGASTLVFNKTLSISGGINVAAGTLDLGNFTTTLASGNLSLTGNVTSGTSGTLIVSGSSTFSGTGTLNLNSLTVNGTPHIAKNTWSLTGSIINNGTLTLDATSNVTFSGGSAQSISGSLFSIGNMTVNKSFSTLSNNGNVELLGTLTMTNGTFDADGTGSGIFTLNSDTNGDARVGAMVGGSIIGNVTFERYFDNTSNRWRNLAFPVTGVTHTALQTSFPVRTNSLSYYVESVSGTVDLGWSYVNSGTLTSTRGHSAWMYNIAPITISVRGPLLKSTPAASGSPYNFGVTYTNTVPGAPDAHDGWNFIPNPFASAINWNNPGWVKTNVNAAAAIWDIESNIYRYTDTGWDGIIASGQAFWVQTNAALPSLTAQESVKVSDSDPVFYREGAIEDKLLVKLKHGVYEDIAAIRFREDATREFDTEYDASKLQNPIFNLSSVTEQGLSLAVNNLPKGPCASNVFLNITNAEQGSYAFMFDGIGSFSDLVSVTLTDHFTNTVTTLENNTSFAFQITYDSKSYGSTRFELLFNFIQSPVNPVTITQQSGILVSNYEEGEHQWFLNDKPLEGANGNSLQAKANGNYWLQILYRGCPLRSEVFTVEGMSRIYPNPVSGDLQVRVSDIIPEGVSSGEIIITSAIGTIVRQETFTKNDLLKTIDMRGVSPGQYIVSISSQAKIFERVKLIVQ